MTTDDKLLKDMRAEVFRTFDDTAIDTATLRALISHISATAPDAPLAHRENEACPTEAERLRWSTSYYNRQKLLAQQNFSIERLNHLVNVRDHLRTQGVKGFAARPATHHEATMNTTHLGAPAASGVAPYLPSENLRRFVKGGELRTIRAALRFELNNNRLSREHLLAALDWARMHAEGVCEPYEEKAFVPAIDTDRVHWTAEYYDTQTTCLKMNFSAERYAHLVDVRLHLRDRGVAGFVPTNNAIGQVHEDGRGARTRYTTTASTQQTQPHQPERNDSSLVKRALLVGGALAAVLILLMLVKYSYRMSQ